MFVNQQFEFHGCKNLQPFFWFWSQKSIFWEKIPLVALGWSVGWFDLVLLLVMCVFQKKVRIPLAGLAINFPLSLSTWKKGQNTKKEELVKEKGTIGTRRKQEL